jgi:hypothetical protein
MSSLKIKLKSGALGDKIATIYSMENCGRQTGQQFEITGHPDCQRICELLHLQHTRYTDNDAESILSIDLKVPAVEGVPYTPYIYRIMTYLELRHQYQPEKASPLMPHMRHMRGNYVVCQFDSRFAAREGFLLKHAEIRRIIRNRIRHDERMFLIGGQDTAQYVINYEYKLGDLEYLLELVFNAKRFLGVDSGIAHLSGVVGTPADICFIMPKTYHPVSWEETSEINPLPTEYFTRSYRNITSFSRS